MMKQGSISDLFTDMFKELDKWEPAEPEVCKGAYIHTPKRLPDNCERGENGTLWHWNDSDFEGRMNDPRICLYS